jgi:hypothetical protein
MTTFEVGDILTVMTGILVARSGVEAVYDLCNYMTGDNLMTHQLPRACDESGPALRAQFPDLAGITVPEFTGGAPEVFAWLDSVEAAHGKTREVTTLPDVDHTYIDPLAELRMMRPDLPIIVIDGD